MAWHGCGCITIIMLCAYILNYDDFRNPTIGNSVSLHFPDMFWLVAFSQMPCFMFILGMFLFLALITNFLAAGDRNKMEQINSQTLNFHSLPN